MSLILQKLRERDDTFVQEPVYPNGRSVKDKKRRTCLIALLPYIPLYYHTFYKYLPVRNNAKTRASTTLVAQFDTSDSDDSDNLID